MTVSPQPAGGAQEQAGFHTNFIQAPRRPAAMKWSTLPVLLLVAGLAGCLQSSPGAPGGQTVDTVLAPKLDARETLDDVKEFSEAFPYRQSGTPAHLAARDDLAARFRSAGLEVVRQSFPAHTRLPRDAATGPAYSGENVIGVKWGGDRHAFVVVGAHYDITEGAAYGAYDDGSGTAMVVNLAEAFATVPTDRTLLFVAFDQEEQGLVGSRAFVEAVDAGRLPFTGAVEAMLDLDMVGITWPHPAHLVVWENSPALEARIAQLAADAKMPADHLEFRTPKGGSSDGATFIAAGIPTAYLWSDWDAYILPDGSVSPVSNGYVGTYPWWHKLDTYETMVASAGDEATLEAGFQTVLDIASPLLLDMARSGFALDVDP